MDSKKKGISWLELLPSWEKPKKKAKKKPNPSKSLQGLTRSERGRLFTDILPDYLQFLGGGKTPHLVVQEVLAKAQQAGFVPYHPSLKKEAIPGMYLVDGDERQFALVRFGTQPARVKGLSVIAAHVDAPCLNLKSHPIVEGPEGILLAGKPYGGIWEHNWVDAEVLVLGRVQKKDKIVYGRLEGLLSDRGIHVTHRDVAKLSFPDAFKHEMLKVVTGFPSKKAFLEELRKRGLEEKDFFRGSWYVVPKAEPFVVGGHQIVGYGHDDRICVYSGVQALLETEAPACPAVMYGCSREEIGSTGGDGAQGAFFDRAVDALLRMEGLREEEISGAVKRALYAKSKMLSADVDVALTSYDQEAQDEKAAARLGQGIVLCKANGGNCQYDGNLAPDTLTSDVLDIFDKAKVAYQATEMPTKLQKGGGGTIAMYFAHRGLPVIDAGPAVANMHGKYPVAHVGDLMQTIKAYVAFMGRKG